MKALRDARKYRYAAVNAGDIFAIDFEDFEILYD